MPLPLLTGLLCLLLGSIPTGYLVGRLKGVDIRSHGSGNTGATNAARVLGKKLGFFVLLLDVGKGMFAAYLGGQHDVPGAEIEIWGPVCGVMALFGHCFSPFLRFRGGKGVATGLGAFLYLAPLPAWFAIAVFLTSIRLTKFVSVSSILAAATVPTLIYFDPKGAPPPVILLCAVLSASLITLRHHANISRLVRGTEPKWGEKKGELPSGSTKPEKAAA